MKLNDKEMEEIFALLFFLCIILAMICMVLMDFRHALNENT